MAAPGAEAPEAAAPAAPGGGAVGGQSSQIVQQIMMLLTQLAQEEPDPAIQPVLKTMMQQGQHLEGLVGKDDEADAMSGLHNPGGEGGGAEAGEPALTVAIHTGSGSKSFSGAKKAAKAAMESGSLPSETERTTNKRKNGTKA